MAPHLIWAFLKASGILSCRAAVATLPRSMSLGEGGSGDEGTERTRVEETKGGRRKCQCDGGLNRTFTGKKAPQHLCTSCSKPFETAVNPLIFGDLSFRFLHLLPPVLILLSASSPPLCEMSSCFPSLTIWQQRGHLHTKIHHILWIIWLQCSLTWWHFLLRCGSFGARILSTQTKYRGLHYLCCKAERNESSVLISGLILSESERGKIYRNIQRYGTTESTKLPNKPATKNTEQPLPDIRSSK